MVRFALAGLVVVGFAGSAAAWNEKGHMVVARVAWKELTEDERNKVIAILEKHPHYEEFLKDDRPSNIPEKEWVFMRAATWSDWVRSGPPARRKFHRPSNHYVNLPFVHPPMTATPPKPPEDNIVAAIDKFIKTAKMAANQVDRAVDTTWLFHLVGDIHQPLHCATLFGTDFPNGDRGGTRAQFRVENRLVQLHSFWDGLLGRSITLSSIGTSVLEIETLLAASPELKKAVLADLAANKTTKAWADEGFESAKKNAYLEGKLPLVNTEDDPDVDDIARAPAWYQERSGEIALVAAYKGGVRLAAVVREVLAEN